MNRVYQVFWVFLAGQSFQLLLRAFVDQLGTRKPLLVCIVIGTMFSAAFFAGIQLTNREIEVTNRAVNEVFRDEIKTH